MITKKCEVIISNTKELGRVVEITSEGICTIILEDGNCCRTKHINELEKI